MPFIEIFLIILGAVVVGIILSVGIIYLIRRFEKPGYPPKKYIIPSPQSSTTPSKNNGASTAPKNGSKEDKLEELLKNHKKVEPAVNRAEPIGVKASNNPAVKQPVSSVKHTAPDSVRQASPVAKQTPVVAPASSSRPPVIAASPVQQTATVAKKPAVAVPKPATERPKVQLPRSDVYRELELNLSIAAAPWSGKVTAFQTTAWDTNQDNIEPELADKRAEIAELLIDIRLANNIVWISNELGNKSPNLDESYKKLCAKIAERIGKVIAPVNGNR